MRRLFGIILVIAGVAGLYHVWSGGDISLHRIGALLSREVNIEKAVDVGAVEHIRIHTDSANVRIVKGESEQAYVRLQGSAGRHYADNIDLHVEQQGDTLELGLEMPEKFWFFFNFANVTLEVTLPEKQWNTVDVETGSGNITIDGLETDSLAFDAGSGNVKLIDGQAEIKGKVGSGNILVETRELLHDADLKTGSGNVTVKLAERPESLHVDYRGGSGQGRIQWDGFVYELESDERDVVKGSFGSGEVQLYVRTGSGNFTLK